MIDWVFFDLGSTLLNETNRTNERIENTARAGKIPAKVLHEQLQQSARTHPYAVHMELPNGFAWAPWPKRPDPLYPDAIPVVKALSKKYRLGVIANHGSDTAARLGIDRFFKVYTASEASGFGKPDLRIFRLALSQADCRPEKAIMIGDRLDNDIAPAKQLGMKTMWIRQGFGGIPEPVPGQEPDYTVHHLHEILDIL